MESKFPMVLWQQSGASSPRPPMYLTGMQTEDGQNAEDAMNDMTVYQSYTADMIPQAGAWNAQFGDGITELQSGISDGSALTGIQLPKNLTTIGAFAFKGSGLEKIVFPDTVKTLGDGCLASCSKLTEIILPAHITALPSGMAASCTALEGIELPQTVHIIGSGAFEYCNALKQIDIPQSVTVIDSGAFKNCSSLTELFLPVSLLTVADSLCMDCKALKSVQIPESVTSIGKMAFYGSALESVTLPPALQSIADHAFRKTSLKLYVY